MHSVFLKTGGCEAAVLTQSGFAGEAAEVTVATSVVIRGIEQGPATLCEAGAAT
jgi:hypothetical protein